MSAISFEVAGIPVTQGSMRAFLPKGKRFPVVTHGNPKTREWRSLVAMEARRVAPETPWTGALAVSLCFRLQRPASHWGARGNIRPSAPQRPAGSRDDLDKLVRAVFDALTGVIWRDDGQVVVLTARKDFGNAGVTVAVEQLDAPQLLTYRPQNPKPGDQL